jgi:hypothetical protein
MQPKADEIFAEIRDGARRVEERFQAVSRYFAFEPCNRASPRETLKLDLAVEQAVV